jgi:hypothetical protein
VNHLFNLLKGIVGRYKNKPLRQFAVADPVRAGKQNAFFPIRIRGFFP